MKPPHIRFTIRRVMVAFVVALAALWGFSHTKTRGFDDPAVMAKVVLDEAPVGSSVEMARRFMERQGFRCEEEANASFRGKSGVNTLCCSRSDGWIVFTEWTVRIAHQGGKVVEVFASRILTGP